MAHVTWFLGPVEKVRFFDVEVHAFADPEAAVARFKAEALIKPTGRTYRQEYVLILRAAGGKIAFLREHFDPTAAAKAMEVPMPVRGHAGGLRVLPQFERRHGSRYPWAGLAETAMSKRRKLPLTATACGA